MPELTSAPNRGSQNYWQQTAQNRMLMVVLAIVVLVPILASPSNEQMQGAAHYALNLMAALLAGILVLRARVATRRSEVTAFLGTGPNMAILLYGSISLISFVFVEPAIRRLALTSLMQIVVGILLYFALAYHVRRSEHLIKIRDALTLVVGLMAVIGLTTLGLEGTGSHAILFGDHQLFGAFLMILFPIPLVCAISEREPKQQIISQIAAVLTGACLLMSGARTAWVGTLAAMAVLMLLSRIGAPPIRKTDWRKYLIPVLLVLSCVLLFVFQSEAPKVISRRLDAESQASSMRPRYLTWFAAKQLIIQSPVWGNGLGSYPVLQEKYSRYGRPGDAVLQNGPALSEMAHNFWLQTTSEQGFVGIAAFAAILISFLTAGIRRLRFLGGGIRRSLLLACLAGIVGFSVDAIANPAWEYSQVSMFLWLTLGIGVACMRPRSSRQDA